MAKDTDKKSEEQTAHPVDFSQLADAFKDIPVQQLMSNPAAAFAAATAFGFGMATQMTDVFLRTMQGAMAEAKKAEAKDEAKDEPNYAADAPSEPVAPVKPAAAAKPETTKAVKAKPAAKKAPAAKPAASEKPKAAEKAPVTAKKASAAPKKAAASKSTDKADKAVAPPKPAAKAAPTAAKAGTKTTTKATRAARADDLKKISGIGPKLEQVLNSKGITRFADVAGLSKAKMAALDAELGLSGRIERDDWAGQAKTLSGSKG